MAPKNDSSTRPLKASGILMGAAFAGMMLPQESDAQVASEPPDYGNSFASRTDLGSGIVLVNGNINNSPGTDVADYFQISGLTPGSTFSIDASLTRTSGAPFISLAIFNSSGSTLTSAFADLTTNPTYTGTLTGTVPGDGILVGSAAFNENSGSLNYTFAIPEPRASVLTAAAALAALAAYRRKKNAGTAK